MQHFRNMYKVLGKKSLLSRTMYLVLCTLYFVLCTSPARAQSVSMSVSPPVVEILLAPGKSVSQTFSLETQGDNLAFTPELHLARPSDAQGHMTIDPALISPSSIPMTITSSGPPTSPTLTFTAASIDIPKDVYLALVFRASSQDDTISNLSSISPGISALILTTITPNGALPTSLEINDFNPPLFHDSWYPLSISPSLHNSADIMIHPDGKYEVVAPSGKTILSVPLTQNLVLGSSSRLLSSSVSGLDSKLSWSPTWHDLGPYRLHLTITTLGGTKISDTEKVVWIFPFRAFLILALSLIIFGYLTRLYNHSKVKSI